MYKLICKLFSVAVCGLSAAIAVAAPPDGDGLYHKHCSVCHGIEGSGGVGVPLHLQDFLAVASDDYLRKSIVEGRPGRVMPAFSQFSDTELDALVGYIRGFSAEPAPAYGDEKIAGDAGRGKQLFTSHCVACHGDNGQGKGGTGVTFSRKREAPIMAPALNNGGFQRSVSDAMLKATLMRGRHETPMPSVEELGLSEADANDLISYIRTLKATRSADAGMDEESIIKFDSSYSLEQTLENLKEAAVGRNFRVIRLQFLEEGLAKPGQENQRSIMLYFCNFAFLYEALAIDPRVGLFLPCRVTVIETDQGVQVMSINPKNLSQLFNNYELDKACQQMYDLYVEIIEEATL